MLIHSWYSKEIANIHQKITDSVHLTSYYDITFINNYYDYFPDNETLKSQTKERNEYLLEATGNPVTVGGKAICNCVVVL